MAVLTAESLSEAKMSGESCGRILRHSYAEGTPEWSQVRQKIIQYGRRAYPAQEVCSDTLRTVFMEAACRTSDTLRSKKPTAPGSKQEEFFVA